MNCRNSSSRRFNNNSWISVFREQSHSLLCRAAP